MIRVILTDDHMLVRKGLRHLIEEQDDMTVVAEAGTAPDLLATLSSTVCDVVVLDISLPQRSGLDVLRQLRASYPGLPVLMLSMHTEEQYALRAMNSGAAGYLTKGSAPENLVTAIRQVHAGRKVFSDNLLEQVGADKLQPAQVFPHQQLSNREFEILLLIAAGYSLTAIGKRMCISIKTVSTYRTRILEKMGMENNVELTAYVQRNHLAETA
jgi:DNA-binding NarL/FixJ family response regulator